MKLDLLFIYKKNLLKFLQYYTGNAKYELCIHCKWPVHIYEGKMTCTFAHNELEASIWNFMKSYSVQSIQDLFKLIGPTTTPSITEVVTTKFEKFPVMAVPSPVVEVPVIKTAKKPTDDLNTDCLKKQPFKINISTIYNNLKGK